MVYRLVTLLLLLAFYGIYYAKQIALRRRGIHTNRLARGGKPARTRRIERSLLAATALTALAQFAGVFFPAHMPALSLPGPVRAAGLLLALCGVAFFALAVRAMQDSWRAGVDATQRTDMVSTGVYRLSRNPAFVGFDLFYLGTALALSGVVLAVMAALAVVLLHLQICEEERFLAERFGGEYRAYAQRVPRYLFVRRAQPRAPAE